MFSIEKGRRSQSLVSNQPRACERPCPKAASHHAAPIKNAVGPDLRLSFAGSPQRISVLSE
jgi:hypothetical protein